MEKRKAMIHFNKSGSGSYTPRATIPAKWTKEMGITPEEREAVLSFDGQKITIEAATIKNFDYAKDGDLSGEELKERLEICEPISVEVK